MSGRGVAADDTDEAGIGALRPKGEGSMPVPAATATPLSAQPATRAATLNRTGRHQRPPAVAGDCAGSCAFAVRRTGPSASAPPSLASRKASNAAFSPGSSSVPAQEAAGAAPSSAACSRAACALA